MLSLRRGELLQHQLGEMGRIKRGDRGRQSGVHGGNDSGLVVLNDGRHHVAQGLAIPQTKNVGRHRVLFDRHLLLA